MKMRDKKSEQRLKKEEHRTRLKAIKKRKRAKEPELTRSEPKKKEKEKFLIVCEGENTEPSYFNKFRLSTAKVKSVGEGFNTVSLVERAERLADLEKFDQVWCVFDKDDFPNEHFNNAIFKAESLGFQVAYSNQAFEYWLILHFEDHQGGAMHRIDYKKKLNGYIKEFKLKYESSKKISDELFSILEAKPNALDKTRRQLACERAQRILNKCNNKNPAKEESSTKVHKLVLEIEKFL